MSTKKPTNEHTSARVASTAAKLLSEQSTHIGTRQIGGGVGTDPKGRCQQVERQVNAVTTPCLPPRGHGWHGTLL